MDSANIYTGVHAKPSTPYLPPKDFVLPDVNFLFSWQTDGCMERFICIHLHGSELA